MRDIFLIKQPHITEKATELQSIGQYVFVVKQNATKNEIKKAVHDLYKVDVESVQVLNVKGKTKRYRTQKGRTTGMRKAVVTLAEGHKIDLSR